MRKGEEKRTTSFGLISNAFTGSLIALGIIFAILLIASFLIVSGILPESLMQAVTIIVLFIGSIVGAAFAVKRNGRQALMVGLAEGALLYIITFVVGAFVDVPTLFGPISLILFAAALLGGAAASLICARPRKRKI